jgi:hypothetical protein
MEPLLNQKVNRYFPLSQLRYIEINTVGRLPKKVTGAVIKERIPINKPTN